eukprot:1011841-Rhodomonas_salina.1
MHSRSSLHLLCLLTACYIFSGCSEVDSDVGQCGAPPAYLKNFILHESVEDSRCNQYLYCNGVRSEECVPTDLCGLPGGIECHTVRSMPPSASSALFPEIQGLPPRLLSIPVGNEGRTFEMYVR